MRKLIGAVLAALTVLTGGLVVSAAPAGAVLVDAAVVVSDTIDPVSPVGASTVYKVEASATGLVFPVSLVSESTGGIYRAAGSSIPPGCTAPVDGTADPTITCDVPLNGSITVYIAIKSVAVGQMTNTSTVTADPETLDTVIDSNSANNSDTETTNVTNSSSQSATYLAENESTTYQHHTLTVVDSDTGVITKLSNAPANGAQCGTQGTCKQGLRIEFFENTVYTGKVKVDVYLGTQHPCGYKAESATCKYLYYRKSPSSPVLPVPPCPAGGTTAGTPCHKGKSWKNPPGPDNAGWYLDVRMDSDDPDLLSPIKGLTTGTDTGGA